MHYIIAPELDPNLETVAIEGEQARHAVRVRRMEPGEPLILLDGAGTTAQATVDGSDKTDQTAPGGFWYVSRPFGSTPGPTPPSTSPAPPPRAICSRP